MNRILPLWLTLLLGCMSAWAGEVTVTGAWIRATAPGQDSASVSLNITSKQDGSLVGVKSPEAEHAQIHTMDHADGMMRMREVDALPLQANQETRLGHGDHLMLVGLKRPLKAGDSVSLQLTIEFAGKKHEIVKVKAEVKPLIGER